MIHLRLRTEYSFRRAYGRIPQVLAAAEGPALAITDGGTWGHAVFEKACKAAARKPIFGAEVLAVQDTSLRDKAGGARVALLARNAKGLEELYEWISLANDKESGHFYYQPRLDYVDLNLASRSGNLFLLSGSGADLARLRNRPNVFVELNPSNRAWNARVMREGSGWAKVVCCDNYFPVPADKVPWEVLTKLGVMGAKGSLRATPMHILNEDELRIAVPEADEECFLNTERIAADCDVKLPKAAMVKYPDPRPLYDMCLEGAQRRGLPAIAGKLSNPEYQARLEMELELIHAKEFTDYFYVIADLVQHAKQHMLVGPARGSSAGSLVCYLLAITDVDPLVHDLMFERFIDVTRADLPDIDIDFQDTKRDLVNVHLRERYGAARVGRLGTILTYKPKSALGDVAKALSIPAFEINDLKGAIIDRSSGDARAQFCINDTFEQLDIGRAMLAKYPQLRLAGTLEGHCTTSGTHAAGVVVTDEPLTKYCAIDQSGAAQIDKKAAEVLNILKIDALGLRTLSVLQDVLDQIGKDRDWLITYPLDDTAAFDVFNEERFTGLFQFEGDAVQAVTRQMRVKCFDDVAAIGALARPGPLHCGATNEFISRRTGASPVTYLHALAEPFTRQTYGTVIYQEQVMMVCRHVGQLTWDDVQTIRRAMSKSLGDEFFGKYKARFVEGAVAQGMGEAEAAGVWDKICTFGSWAFNKSHAVSYGLLGYWCAMLKAHYPLEFAAAILRNPQSEEQCVAMLRELVRAGYTYVPVDPERSGLTWEVRDGELIGGLTNIKGVGESKAQTLLALRKYYGSLKRASEQGRFVKSGPLRWTGGLDKFLGQCETPYDDIFTGARRFAALIARPRDYGIVSGPITSLKEITEPGDYVFIARIREKNLRDMNEEHSKAKRGGRVMTSNNLFLNLVLEDDSARVYATIGRYDYAKLGKPLVEGAKVGDWYLWLATKDPKWGRMSVQKWRCLETDEWPK